MLYIVAHLYAYPGKEAELREFETHALGIARKHGGELMCAFAPECAVTFGETPTEVHVLRFADQTTFENFKGDPEHAAISDWRATVIRKTVVFVSGEIVEYGNCPGD